MKTRIALLVISLLALAGLALWFRAPEQEKGSVLSQRNKPERQSIIIDNTTPFVSDRTGSEQLMIYSEATDSSLRLLPSTEDQFLPRMNGRGELWYFTESSGFYRLWRMADTKEEPVMVMALRSRPVRLTVSQSGEYGIYTIEQNSPEIRRRSFVFSTSTGEVEEIGQEIRGESFSPDGRSFVYASASGLWYRELLTIGTLTDALQLATGSIWAPSLQADGSALYLSEEEGGVGLYRAGLRGQSNELLISLPGSPQVVSWTMDVAPNGLQAVYTAVTDYQLLQGQIGFLSLADPVNTEVISDSGIAAQWSADEETIWYNQLSLGSGEATAQIWRMYPDGNYREAITTEGNNWLTVP
ncbi:MAG: WD40 repeat domain-containing protein [bacterium]|nr:WD40 repeat domain-containing protein [bacterium]